LIAVALGVIQLAGFVTDSRAEFIVGVKAGPSFASQSGENLAPEVTWSTRTGLAIGADLELSLAHWLWLRTEPMYVQKGSEVDWSPDIPLDNVQEYDYFSIPLNLKAVLSSGTIQPFVFVGPSIAFTLSSQARMNEDGTEIQLESEDIEFGLDFGAGTDISIGDLVGVCLDFRYSLGLTNLNTDIDSSKKNRAVLVLAGLFVRL
jgi:hypothetical protein